MQQEQQKQQIDPNKSKTLGNYILGKTIGKGTFGKVKLATHTVTGQKVAIKILQKDKIIDVADVQRVSRQIHILKLIRHPGIIQLYEIIETSKHLFLIMEYMQNGQLFDYIVKCKKIPQEEACRIFQQIVGGVQYLHKLNIVHRDLKPQNLLLDYDNSIRLVDFGLSNTYRNEQRLKTACGSPCYAAPEMIEGKNRYDPLLVDIWSCGVILYAMLCGCLPFEDQQTPKLYQKILSGQYRVPKHLSIQAQDIISKILTVNPQKRFKIQDMRNHRWWKKVKVQNNFAFGIIIGYHRIPVDQRILIQTVKLGFQEDFTKKCLQANRHNSATTTYYLLMKKHLRLGGSSETDLGCKDFNPVLIQPIKKIKPQIKLHSSQLQSSKQALALSKIRTIGQNKKKDTIQKQRKNKTIDLHTYSKMNKTNYNPQSDRDKFRITGIPNIQANRNKNKKQIFQISNQGSRGIGYNDKISQKYKESYGIPMISRSKQKERHSSGQKRMNLSGYNTKFHFNQTIHPFESKKKSYQLGADLGFDDEKIKNVQKIHPQVRQPYIKRGVFH